MAFDRAHLKFEGYILYFDDLQRMWDTLSGKHDFKVIARFYGSGGDTTIRDLRELHGRETRELSEISFQSDPARISVFPSSRQGQGGLISAFFKPDDSIWVCELLSTFHHIENHGIRDNFRPPTRVDVYLASRVDVSKARNTRRNRIIYGVFVPVCLALIGAMVTLLVAS